MEAGAGVGGRRGGGGEPICVYGFGGKEINDLTFLFGFNEVGIEGLCPLGSTLHPRLLACPLLPDALVCDLDAGPPKGHWSPTPRSLVNKHTLTRFLSLSQVQMGEWWREMISVSPRERERQRERLSPGLTG